MRLIIDASREMYNGLTFVGDVNYQVLLNSIDCLVTLPKLPGITH